MALKLSETRERLDRECSFPIERDAVIDAVGDVAIQSPNGDESDLETVLTRSGETTYASVDDLHNSLLGNLGDDHVGRKYYDDRSSTPAQETELSF